MRARCLPEGQGRAVRGSSKDEARAGGRGEKWGHARDKDTQDKALRRRRRRRREKAEETDESEWLVLRWIM